MAQVCTAWFCSVPTIVTALVMVLVAASWAHAGDAAELSAAAARQQQGLVFVDIRGIDAFQASHIPASLQASPFTLKTLHFLKNRSFVVVNDGYAAVADRMTVEQLRGNGFPGARCLDGGIQAWVETGGPLEGSQPSGESLWTVSARRLLTAEGVGGWIGVVATNDLSDPLAETGARLIPVDCRFDLGVLRERSHAQDAQGGPASAVATVLISAPDCSEGDVPGLLALLEKTTGRRPYTLEGGWPAYVASKRMYGRLGTRQLTTRTEVISSRTRGCATCPQP